MTSLVSTRSSSFPFSLPFPLVELGKREARGSVGRPVAAEAAGDDSGGLGGYRERPPRVLLFSSSSQCRAAAPAVRYSET